jgi:opacity protein-like surface antigen
MLRKIGLALATAAALCTAALAPTSASAWGGGFHGGWHGNSYDSYNSQNLAGRPVDQVDPPAGSTRPGLTDLGFDVRRTIGEPSLHIQARCGASKGESCHVAA